MRAKGGCSRTARACSLQRCGGCKSLVSAGSKLTRRADFLHFTQLAYDNDGHAVDVDGTTIYVPTQGFNVFAALTYDGNNIRMSQ